MNKRRRSINKEKIFSVRIALAVLLTIGIGVYAVVSSSDNKQQNNNVVDLNELSEENDNVAMNDVEEVPEPETVMLPGDIEGESTDADIYNEDGWQSDLKTANAGNTETLASDDAAVGVDAGAIMDPLSAYSFNEESSIKWPVNGEIILKYSMDSTILFKSLGVYKCNPAISIAAEEGTNVGVAADGIVKSVIQSEETGTTVCIEIGGGYETTYGLLKDVVVKEGDKVTAGQLLGTVAAPTAYYAEEGSNVYFKMTKDGIAIDPTSYFAE